MGSYLLDLPARARHLADRTTIACNARFRRAGAPDGLPLPPAKLVHKVVGHFDLEVFYEGGRTRFDYLQSILTQGGVDVDALRDVLDWGCGSGRVLRQWRQRPQVQIYGTDYNPELIAWCRDALPFARLSTNGLAPPLPFPDNSFDLLYGISVFTHLAEHMQLEWIEELKRVVRPGGYLLLTFNGTVGREALEPSERTRFDAGELIIHQAGLQGHNFCAAFHPAIYVRERLGAGLEVLAEVPAQDPPFDHGQDGYLLRLPA